MEVCHEIGSDLEKMVGEMEGTGDQFQWEDLSHSIDGLASHKLRLQRRQVLKRSLHHNNLDILSIKRQCYSGYRPLGSMQAWVLNRTELSGKG